MKLEDVTQKLCALRMKRRSFPTEEVYPKLVEALTEYTLVEPPRFWYLLEIPEPSASSKGGWRKVVEIMKRRGYNPTSSTEEEALVNFLASAYTFSASTQFRSIVSALMIKISREAGLLHHWHRILYVTAKTLLDKDLAADDFDPQWNEKLELDQSFLDLCTAAAAEQAMEAEKKSAKEHGMATDDSQACPPPTNTVKRKRKPRGTNKSAATKSKTHHRQQQHRQTPATEEIYKLEPYWADAMDTDTHFIADPYIPAGTLDNNLVNVIFI